MKKHILTVAAVLAMMFVGGGCDYNDDNFDGLQDGTVATDVKTLEFTLSDADYTAIAGNSANKALAGEQDKDALAAFGKNKYFTQTITPAKYIPAFLASTYPTADNTSSIKVTSNVVTDLPEELTTIQAATEYRLKADDYKAAWEDGTVKFFTPSKPAEEFVPGILAKAIETPEAGGMAMVTYTYYDGEPESDAAPALMSARVAPLADTPASVTSIADLTLDNATVYTSQATVIATYAKGLLVEDATGQILVYTGKIVDFALGDEILITGSTRKNFDVPQFNNTGLELKMVKPRADVFAYPAAATTITTANIPAKFPAAAGDVTAYDPYTYLTLTGTVKKDGNFYNVIVKGAGDDALKASLTNPFEALDLAKYDGKEVEVAGYLISINAKSKYFGIITTSITETGAAPLTPLGIAASKEGTYTSKGAVVATYNKGFLMNDGTATMTVYLNTKPEVNIGDIVEVSGATEIRYGMAQFKRESTVKKTGKVADIEAVRPAVAEVKGPELETYLALPCYEYVKYAGTLTINDKYYEVHNIEGSKTVYGSLSYPLDDQEATIKKLAGKNVVVTGYLIGSNTSKGYVTTVVLSVESATAYDTETRNALYAYENNTWTPVEDVLTLQPADYKSMGLQSDFSATNAPDKYLPTFLKTTKPYAQAEDKVFVAYNFYDAAAKATVLRADEYAYDGSQWTRNTGIVEQTDQFVKSDGKWVWDPSVTIILPVGKSQELSTLYYQACVDWVKDNVPDGAKYVTSYGNNEYYTGASAYQNNLDWRVAEARAQYPEGYAGMDDAQIAEALKQHTIEVFGKVLAVLNPDAKVVEGVEVTYTIHVGVYLGSSITAPTHKLVYKVVGNPEFEFVSFDAL